MIFNKFFKKFDPTVNAFIDYSLDEVLQYVPIDYSAKFLPNWFKKVPNTMQLENSVKMKYNSSNTIKTCYGIKHHLTNGFILPMWCDLILDIFPDATYKFQFVGQSKLLTLVQHDRSQYGHLFYNEYMNIKLISPWFITTNIPRRFYATFPFYHNENPPDFLTMPGFIEFNSITHDSNVNMLVKVKPEPYRIFIPAGYPLVQYITTDKKHVKLNVRCGTEQEISMLKSFISLKFLGNLSFKSRIAKNKNHEE